MWDHCDHMNDTVGRNSLDVGQEAQHAPRHSSAQRDAALRSLLCSESKYI